MKRIARKLQNTLFFSKRDADLPQRVKSEFIDSGIATIPCNVSSYDDIVSRYSVKGYETLNPEFTDYVEGAAAFIPAEYPIVLEISGKAFSDEEQESIRNTIREDFLYGLGGIQAENKKQMLVSLFMMAGMLISGFLVFYKKGIPAVSLEFIYIFFWFFADIFVSYVILENPENIRRRTRAGRLASMTVVFSEEHDDSALTEEDVRYVYDDMYSKGRKK